MFDENLIASGGKQLISQTKYQFSFIDRFLKHEKGEKMMGNNMFYFVIKGIVKVQSPFYQKIITHGQYFGHL